MRRTLHLLDTILSNVIMLCIVAALFVRSDWLLVDKLDRIRVYTRWQEFNFVAWTLDALGMKQAQAALGAPRYMDIDQQRETVYRYLALIQRMDRLNYEVTVIYADPNVDNPEQASADKRAELAEARALEKRLAPLAEEVLQAQLSEVLRGMGLVSAGQPMPPVLYHVTPLPYALIVSPRTEISQEANISLLPGLSLEERIRMEDDVATNLDKSALVVAIGGVGVYPTMVQSTSDIVWLTEVVAHEWIHNFLTLRPLGVRYDATPQMRTINETTASLAGKEIGRALLERFYPEKVPPPPPEPAPEPEPSDQPAVEEPEPTPPVFDFRKEMRVTRLETDRLLAEGKVVEAEAYMEARRKVFWDNGYLIRKLNQAYFAFHGAYNDTPGGGAAGEDPVGPAVQALRQRYPSLAAFLRAIGQVKSFEELQGMLQ